MRQAKGRRVAGRMNTYEKEYEQLFLGKKPHGYEEITLRLGDDARLTIDFWVMGEDDVLEFHEVKGSFIRPDALVKLRVAAERYPWFRFKMFQKASRKMGGGWKMVSFSEEDQCP